jgi:hypothetical protein
MTARTLIVEDVQLATRRTARITIVTERLS